MDPKNYDIIKGFNIIAPAYDLANDAMTFGMHRLWRKKLCRTAAKVLPPKGTLLDLATGTADVILGVLKYRQDKITVKGVDAAEEMLKIAQDKLNRQFPFQKEDVEFLQGDACKLQFEDNTFDVVTISWGIRNVKPFQKGLQEILRVLKPGGTILVLESGKPEFKIMRTVYKYYSKLLPLIGNRISKFKPAYKYYVQSVETFPSGKNFLAELFDAGFVNTEYQTLGGSVVYLYSAQKPSNKELN